MHISSSTSSKATAQHNAQDLDHVIPCSLYIRFSSSSLSSARAALPLAAAAAALLLPAPLLEGLLPLLCFSTMLACVLISCTSSSLAPLKPLLSCSNVSYHLSTAINLTTAMLQVMDRWNMSAIRQTKQSYLCTSISRLAATQQSEWLHWARVHTAPLMHTHSHNAIIVTHTPEKLHNTQSRNHTYPIISGCIMG